MKKILAFVGLVFSLIYILNPSAGIFEFLPDNIPFLGNLDEGFFTFLFFSCLQYITGRKFGMFQSYKKNGT